MARWPNVERMMVAWIADYTHRPVFTETDASLGDNLPAYKVERTGGGDLPEVDKTFLVEVNTVGVNRPMVWEAVGVVMEAMEALAANGTPEWYVDDVTEVFGHSIEPYDNTGKRMATSTYELTIRPR